MINITFPDGSVRPYDSGITAWQIAQGISPKLASEVLAAAVKFEDDPAGNTVIYDLERPLEKNCSVRLLKWDNLDTLELTLNYLEGSLPTDDQIRSYIGKGNWSYSDKVQFVQDGEDRILSVADSLAAPGAPDADVAYGEFDALQIPKVLPKLRVFSINLNRFSGSLDPDTHKWLMYHPLMDWWEPSTFIFTQEGTDSDGRAARFDDIPVNMDYYYDVYANKKFAD